MDDTQPPPSESTLARPGGCAYCNAELDPAYYFCRKCATPYKSHTLIVGRPRPQPQTIRERMQTHAPAAWNLFWTYVLVLLGSGLLFFVAMDAGLGVGMLLTDLALGVTTIVVSIMYFATLRPQFARIGFDQGKTLLLFLGLPALLFVNFAWMEFLTSATRVPEFDILDNLRDAGLTDTAIFLLVAVFPAVSEEIAFRGLLQPWMQAALGKTRGLVVVSALFAAIHMSILSAPYLFLAGLYLGWLRQESGSLYPCMLAHLLHNWWVIEWVPLG